MRGMSTSNPDLFTLFFVLGKTFKLLYIDLTDDLRQSRSLLFDTWYDDLMSTLELPLSRQHFCPWTYLYVPFGSWA